MPDPAPDVSDRDESSAAEVPVRVLVVAVALLVILLVGLSAVIALDSVSGVGTVLALVGACTCVGLIVVVLPPRWRTKAGSFAAAFVAAAGVLPSVLSAESSSDDPGPRTNPAYLAQLVRQGPFTERLPSPLVADRFVDVQIGDPDSSSRIDAVRLKIRNPSPEQTNAFALVEIYSTPKQAAARLKTRTDLMISTYGRKNVYGRCTDEFGAHGGGWTCVQARGYAFVEVAFSPGDNAHKGYTTGILTALLRYTDKLTKAAT